MSREGMEVTVDSNNSGWWVQVKVAGAWQKFFCASEEMAVRFASGLLRAARTMETA